MRQLRAWLFRFAGLFTGARRERELADEIESHLEMHIEDNLRAGMSPEEARRQARLMLGGPEQAKELVRDRRGLPVIDHLLQDLRFGLRMLRRNPGFTAVAMLTLALGIGANAAIFSVVNAVLLRPLPFPDSERLVLVWATDARRNSTEDVASYPDFEDWRAQSRSFESLAAFTTRGALLSGGSEAELVPAMQVTPGFFETLGVQPAMGRGFLPEEQEQGASRVVILSDAFWRLRFAARADILGQTIEVNEQAHTVIGVMSRGFVALPGSPEGIYTPLVRDPNRNHGFLRVLGRLKPGISVSAAQAEMNILTSHLAELHPKTNKGVGANVMPLVRAVAGPARTGLWIFLGVVGLVLLIACTNVANLLLARSSARQKELAVRVALGAGRGRLVRQLLTESALLSLAGGTLGLLAANWIGPALAAALAASFPVARIHETHTDAAVIGFTLALSIATGLLFGVMPAFSSASPNLNESLRESGHTLGGSGHKRRIRAALVIVETAMALVLLAGAGLLLKTLYILRNTAPGFRSENLLTVDLWLPRIRFASQDERLRFFQSVLARVEAIPGVRSAALVADLPLGGGQDSLGFHIPGRPDPAPAGYFHSSFNIASPGYFRTMGIPLIAGREFTSEDLPNTTNVIIINKKAAQEFWPGEDPLGKQIVLPVSSTTSVTLTVVGVTGDVRDLGLGVALHPQIVLDYLQPGPPWPWLTLVVHTAGDPAQLAGTVKSAALSVDRGVPIERMRTMDDVLAGSLAQPRLYTGLLGAFALLALALAAVGLYGVVSYTVAQRTHEIGIRMALGARRMDVLRLVLGQGFKLSMLGVAVGLAGAYAAARLLTRLIPSLQPDDPLTLAGVSAVLIGVALLASYIPARRAARVDPVIALRYE